jgi:FKBP-type peptidyl-prolyl cis-trans isomerase SlyD
MITEGSVVTFEYTVFDENGAFLESNKGETPVTYTHGKHEIIPALEKGLSDMEVNEERTIRLVPEEAFGPVNPEGFKEVSRDNVPVEDLEVGALLEARGPGGEELTLRVHEIKDQTVVLDLNHPLAGRTLNFGVKVLDIKPPLYM